MRVSIALIILTSQLASAHYTFSQISVNGGPVSDPWYYIRNVIQSWAYDPNGPIAIYNPAYYLYDENVRCGRGAATIAARATLTVNAGDELAFFATANVTKGGEWIEKQVGVFHEGPGQAYLSRTGGDLDTYEGDGDWFKIGSIISKERDESAWELYNKPSMNFTIPKTTPPGKYLMRVEHLFPLTSRFNDTQFYINCAQLEIKGPGGGNPGPMAKFPGEYSIWDPAIWVPYRVALDRPINLTGYLGPGPAVWTG